MDPLIKRWKVVAAAVLVVGVGVSVPLLLWSGTSTSYPVQIHDVQVGYEESESSTALICSPGPCSAAWIARFHREIDTGVTFVVSTFTSAPGLACSVAVRDQGRKLDATTVFLDPLWGSTAWVGTAMFHDSLAGVSASDVKIACN